jgi:hypothetical protein
MGKAHRAAVEAHVETVVLLALLAVAAAPAWAARIDGTRVPGATPVTSAPTRVTVPAISWPRIIGSLSRTVPKPPSK